MSQSIVLFWAAVALIFSGCASVGPAAGKPDAIAMPTRAGPVAAAPMRVDGAMRGVWIPAGDHTDFWRSPARMANHFAELASAGFNTAFVVVWNQGRTFYPSAVMRNLTGVEIHERLVGRDPLQEVITAAKPHGIDVYAWFEFGFATDMNGGTGREIGEKKPGWVSLTRDGKPAIKNGFRWLNSLDPEVQNFMLALLMEVVDKYDLKGIQGDDRLPAMPSEGGYNPVNVAAFAAAFNGEKPGDPKDAKWVQWRSDRLTDFLERVYRETKRRKPGMVVSMSPSVWPWARDEYLQDWPAWVKRGIVDTVSPQLYRYDFEKYHSVLKDMARSQAPEFRQRIFPGVLLNLGRDYRASPEFLRRMLEANRAEGITGEVFFYHEGVRPRLAEFRALYGDKP